MMYLVADKIVTKITGVDRDKLSTKGLRRNELTREKQKCQARSELAPGG
jgi:hypothetical protein